MRRPKAFSHTSWQSLGIIGLILVSGSSALAVEEYYIVQDTSTKQCAIVDIPPTTTKLVLLDNGKLYSDRNEAEGVMASLACTGSSASAYKLPNAGPSASANKLRDAVRTEGRAGGVKVRSKVSMQPGPKPKPVRPRAPVLSSREQLSPF
jgi:hypothetical protein